MPRTWFLILFSNERNLGSLEKRLVLGLDQGIYMISLEHLVSARKKESAQKIKARGYVKGTQETMKEGLMEKQTILHKMR